MKSKKHRGGPVHIMKAPPIQPEKIPNEHTKIMNVTWHLVEIGEKQFPSVGMVRLTNETKTVGEAAGVPITETIYSPSMVPQKEYNAIFIVSVIICQMNPDRDDFYIPASKNSTGKYMAISQNPYYKNYVNRVQN